MAFEQRSLDDYIDVAQRIADFREKYPEGSLSPFGGRLAPAYQIIQAEGFEKNGDVITQTFVVVVAAAYRSPKDTHPGVGMAWEIFPGRTPYTRGSELQNAETSAWGRAIIAVGASDSKRGIASREEVRNRQAERDDSLGAAGIIAHVREMRRKDPEVDEHGAATLAEQTRMMTGSEGGVHRSKDAVVDDRWTTDAPSWLVGVDPPEDQPGSILEAQRKQIMAVYSALGKRSHDDRMKDIENVLGVALDSTNELSHQQAARLLENLHERHTGKMTRR